MARSKSAEAAPLAPPPVRHTPFVLGHAGARGIMGKALRSGVVHHAWILHGEPGVGKLRTAEAFARIYLDPAATPEQKETLEPPVGTHTAHLIDAGTHADFHMIRKELAALSDSRELRERKQLNIPLDLLRERMLGGTVGEGARHESAVFRTATHGHGKVFIIDEAELLDADGQNAMLKTLEEPPPHTVVMLVTSREDRLLPTIRSRCQRVAFGPLDANTMRLWWERSGVEVPAADRAFVEGFSEGSPGMAERAVQYGLAAWNTELNARLDELEAGRFPAGLGERLAEMVDELAKIVVDKDDNASKEAANRLGARLLSRLLGLRIRRAMRSAGEDTAALERALAAQAIVAEMEQHIRANVNMKHALGNCVAQWADACARAGSAA